MLVDFMDPGILEEEPLPGRLCGARVVLATSCLAEAPHPLLDPGELFLVPVIRPMDHLQAPHKAVPLLLYCFHLLQLKEFMKLYVNLLDHITNP